MNAQQRFTTLTQASFSTLPAALTLQQQQIRGTLFSRDNIQPQLSPEQLIVSMPATAAAKVLNAHDLQAQQQHSLALDPSGGPPMVPGQKLLRRGHQIELMQQAKVLCDCQDFVDLTIYCEDGVVRAHQMLFAVASPFLKLLFQTSPMYGIDEIAIILPEVKACLVQALIHFVYTGTVVSKEDHFYSLMKLVYALNINASIEAESTNEKPTTFGAPHAPHAFESHYQLLQQTQSGQPHAKRKFQCSMQQPAGLQPALPQTPNPPSHLAQIPMNLLPTAPTPQPPAAKMARLSGGGGGASSLQQPIHQTLTVAPGPSKMPSIQLPTQPVPLVNGVLPTQPVVSVAPPQTMSVSLAPAPVAAPPTSAAPAVSSAYIAIDPTTGLSYRVELPNGQLQSAGGEAVSEDPLAAIMNQTIFEGSGAATATMYTTENGTVVYHATQAPPPPVAAAMPAPVAAMPEQQQRCTSGGGGGGNGAALAGSAAAASSAGAGNAAQNKGGGKKKKSSGSTSSTTAASSTKAPKENAILADSVDDLPCAPDDDDINTPYACEHCNKTIKGRIMLQAHQYQEHYDNPEADRIDLSDKHACRVCLKLFTRNSDVKAHILRVHCGDRRYPCTMCGKRFKESTHLRKHLYTHTGERPHYCQLCNKGFQTSSDLKRHKRTRVHQERVEQASQGRLTIPADGDWVDDDEEEPGEVPAVTIAAPRTQAPPVTPATVQAAAATAPSAAAANTTAQALLNNITQPLAMSVPVTPGAPVAVAAGTTFVAVGAAAAPANMDMKALGTVVAWNNNQGTGGGGGGATSGVGQAPGSGSTLDLKAIAGSSTLDMSALKWQGGGGQGIGVASSATGPSGPVAVAVPQQPGQQPQQQPGGLNGGMKRSSSVDSPGHDEERLQVVEADDSSQDAS